MSHLHTKRQMKTPSHVLHKLLFTFVLHTIIPTYLHCLKMIHFKNLSISKLELFLILFPVEYLEEIFIPETNRKLSYPMDFGGYILLIGYWVICHCGLGLIKVATGGLQYKLTCSLVLRPGYQTTYLATDLIFFCGNSIQI